MKNLQPLGLVFCSLLSLNSYAEDTYTYQQEFESFRQSEEFNQTIETFVDTATSEQPGIIDATQRSAIVSLLGEVDFILLYPESLPTLNASIKRLCEDQEMEMPAVVILNRVLPQGEEVAQQFEGSNAALIIDKDYLLKSTDTEIETFILGKINELKQKTLDAETK